MKRFLTITAVALLTSSPVQAGFTTNQRGEVEHIIFAYRRNGLAYLQSTADDPMYPGAKHRYIYAWNCHRKEHALAQLWVWPVGGTKWELQHDYESPTSQIGMNWYPRTNKSPYNWSSHYLACVDNNAVF